MWHLHRFSKLQLNQAEKPTQVLQSRDLPEMRDVRRKKLSYTNTNFILQKYKLDLIQIQRRFKDLPEMRDVRRQNLNFISQKYYKSKEEK